MQTSGSALPNPLPSWSWSTLLAMARAWPDKEALVTPRRRLTYRALIDTVIQVQQDWANQGLKSGDHVVTLVGNDWSYVIFYWAAIASGLVFVPLNIRLAAPEIAPILNEVDPSLIIAEETLFKQVGPPWLSVTISVETALKNSAAYPSDRSYPPIAPKPNDVAVILYTSGTSGLPKGVMLTHQNISVQFYQASSALIKMRSDDRVVSLYPIFHTAQHVFLQAPLTIGATCVIDTFHPDQVIDLLKREAISIFFGVPAMYHILLQNDAFRAPTFPRLRTLAYGASIMPKETIEALRGRFPQAEIQNLYGQTENSPAVSGLDDAYALSKPGSVGRPLPGMTIAIVDDQDHEVDQGIVGEIVTRGINQMKGYYRNESATREAVRDGWYHTGDVGYLDGDGFLYVVDRKKDMIIRGGQNIYSAEVENVLYTHPDIVECAVVGVPHAVYGEEVLAMIVLKQGSGLNKESLQQYMATRIARYKVPVHVQFVDELPHNASGKILKRVIKSRWSIPPTTVL